MNRIYTCTDFPGHYPVGTAAVVVANDRGHADRLLRAEIKRIGLDEPDELSFDQIFPTKAQAVILRDGNY